MKAKLNKNLLLTLSALFLTTQLFAQSTNNQTGTPSGCGNPLPPIQPPETCEAPAYGGNSSENSQGANHFNTITGDVQRKVDDLTLFGGVGDHKLVWSRMGHSRNSSGLKWFGQAHTWRHSYQWEMVQSSTNLIFYYPDGHTYTYSPSGTNWVGIKSNPDVLKQYNVTNFVLQRANGMIYNFNQYTNPASFYQLDSFKDASGNTYTLTYDASNRLSRVTEPGGRWLQVNYEDISIDSENFNNLATVNTAPANNQWTTITSTDNTPYRYLRYIGGGEDETTENFSGIAEMKFFDTNGVQLTGTAFGNGPAKSTNNTYEKATDGNVNTFYQFYFSHYGFTGIDLGSAQAVGSIQFYPRSGYPGLMLKGKFQGANTAPMVSTVIGSVETSDGRSVNYNYTATNDAVLQADWLMLTSVSYGDGTTAHYEYSALIAGQRPLLISADDPRVNGVATQLRYEYWVSNSFYGGIYAERSTDGTLMAKLTGTGGYASTVSFVTLANGAVRTIGGNVNNGGVAASTNALGQTTKYTYGNNGAGYKLSKTDALGRVTSYVRDSQGRATTITNADGGIEKFVYDSFGLPLKHTNALKQATIWTRDAQHRVTGVTYADGSSEAYTYNSFGQPLTHTLKNGGVEKFGYSASGLLLASTNALGFVTSYTYNANDLLASVTDANGNTTSFYYEERGHQIAVVNADGSYRTYGYDAYGNQTAMTNEVGAVWQTQYDEYRRVTAKIDPLGRTTVYSYDLPSGGGSTCGCASSQNKPTMIVAPGGEVAKLTYDLEWRLLSQTVGYGTAQAATTSYQYDAAGQMIAMTDPNGKNWTYTYDALGRRLTQADPLSNQTQYVYDKEGNQIKEIRADGGVTTNGYDNLNRLTLTRDPLSRVTQMAYDASGNLTTLTDANGNVTHWSYDLLNRQTAKTYADSTHDNYGFDAAGNLASMTNAAGQVATHTYDNRNRLTQTTWSAGSAPTITSTYDLVGRLATLDNGNAAQGYAYDAANQLLAESNSVAGNVYVVSYGYDADGRKQTLVYPSGNTLTNVFTVRGQLKEIHANGPPPLATFTYDANGNRLSLALNNGVTNGYAYDNASRLTSLIAKNGGTTVASFAYSYNSINDRTAVSREDGRTENYGYDAARQLTGATYGDTTSEGFNYDAMGNLQSRTGVAPVTNTINNLNQYTSVNGNATGFDAKGNLLTFVGASSTSPTNNYAYDAQNRLTIATRDTNGAVFIYDGRNRCVQRNINGTTTTFIYDGWDLIAEYVGTTPIAEYIHGPGTDEMLARATAIGTVYYTGDALNSTAALTDGSGNVVERYRYTAFGQPSIFDTSSNLLTSSSYGNRFTFQGREWFAEFQLTDHRNRYYSPDMNRWLNRDPIGEKGGVNLYEFVKNEPISTTDPIGLWTVGIYHWSCWMECACKPRVGVVNAWTLWPVSNSAAVAACDQTRRYFCSAITGFGMWDYLMLLQSTESYFQLLLITTRP